MTRTTLATNLSFVRALGSSSATHVADKPNNPTRTVPSDLSATSAASAKKAVEAAKKWAGNAELSVAQFSALSETIAKVASSIEAIGRRTRLLSLNAAIEANRLGAKGEAFGQIALEFKILSTETSEVATTIANQLYKVRHQTGEIVDAVNVINDLINEAAIHVSCLNENQKNEV